jgi:GNAT superfamily N-acetyltransferase
MVRTQRVDTGNRRDVARFVRFPEQLYRGNPHWCPRWEPAVRRCLDRSRHPFYEHSEAEFFLAVDGDRVLGRIAALHNRHFTAHQNRPCGFFHYFEVVENFHVAEALLGAARDWLRSRGLTEVVGPTGLLKLDGGGVLVEGFDQPATMGVAYNHPYYDEFLQRAGLGKRTDYLSGRVDHGHHLSERLRDIGAKAQRRHGFVVPSFRNRAELVAWVPRIARVYEDAFASGPDYYPRTAAERAVIAEEMLAVADPRLIKLVLHDDEVAGFLLAFPDLRNGLRQARGRLWPWGWWSLWQASRRSPWAQVTHVGVLPSFRRRGANAVLFGEFEQTFYARGYQHAEVLLVAEDNRLSIADQTAIGVRWCKRHRVYQGAL